MNKIWNIAGHRGQGKSLIEDILLSKGVTDTTDMKEFLSDQPQKTYDPFLIKNMRKAVKKIKENIAQENKIIIYGDYDVDGVSSTALLVEFLKGITSNIDYYIPNRFSEGYGMNKEALLYTKEEMQGDLIITVDNGISSYDEIEYAKEIGLDIIVTDHHNPPKKIPECIVVNVKQEGDEYPFKELCGCGVAFKLVQALQRELNLPKKAVNDLLDLVTLGTICDLVPLVDENRTMVKYGLRAINRNKRIGLTALRKVTGLEDKEISAGRIGYTIGPCFNAAGRIEDAKIGVELLLGKDRKNVQRLSQILHNLNTKRQRVQADGEKYCKKLVEEKYFEDNFLILRADHVSEGVIGIVAGKIKEIFYKPTLVLTRSKEGYLKGSGRSIPGIHIYKEMSMVSDLLLSFGGHEMACGFSIQEDHLEEFRKKLNNQATNIRDKNPDIFIPKINILAEIEAKELTLELIQEISKLEPYGVGNSKPIFITKNIQVNHSATKVCGKDHTHLKFSGKKESTFLNGIGFSLAEKYPYIQEAKSVDIAFCADINEYNGHISPQMKIEDIRSV